MMRIYCGGARTIPRAATTPSEKTYTTASTCNIATITEIIASWRQLLQVFGSARGFAQGIRGVISEWQDALHLA
eukprot:2465135-Pyramimonas_sp.AAC.1